MACTVAGHQAKVGAWLRQLVAQTGADELMIGQLVSTSPKFASARAATQALGDLLTQRSPPPRR